MIFLVIKILELIVIIFDKITIFEKSDFFINIKQSLKKLIKSGHKHRKRKYKLKDKKHK
jgi:hypothetical protein